jgi:hypothetical protein
MEQGRHYIKLNNLTYLQKILDKHKWMIDNANIAKFPILMSDDKKFMQTIDDVTGPPGELDETKLQVEMNFNYCQAIGEIMYALVTC